MPSHNIAVLIADDDLSQAEGLAEWLRRKEKVAATTVLSGEKALEMLQRTPKKYDVVILDQIFPGGPSGIEVLQQIKAEFPDIFVIMFTQDAGEAGLEALRKGAYRYFLKPINNQELGFLIQHVSEIREMERRLREENQLIEAMRQISQQLISAPKELLLQKITDAGRNLLNVPVCILWEQDRLDGRYKVKAWSGEIDAEYRNSVTIDGNSQATRTFLRNREPLQFPDVQSSPSYEHKAEAAARSWVSALTVPIAAQERVFGILDVYSHQPRHFAEWEKRLLSVFAAQAALVIRQTTLMSYARKTSLLAVTGDYGELADLVVEAVSDVTGTAVSLWMIEHPEEGTPILKIKTDRGLSKEYKLRATLTLDPEDSIVATSLQRKRPISRRDIFSPNDKPQFRYLDEARARGWKSFLSVPLLGQSQQPIGALSVYGLEVRDFGEEEISLLVTFANQAAIAFENQQRHRSLTALIESGKIAAEEISDEPTVLRHFAEQARELTGAPCVVIYPYDPERGAFYDRSRVVTVGVHFPEKELSDTPREKGLAAIIRNVGRVVVHDLSHGDIEDVDYENAGEPLDRDKLIGIIHHEGKPGFVEREGVKAFIGVSLKAVENIGAENKLAEVGVMYINFREPHRFTSAELSLIQLFAQQAANLIRATRMRSSLQEQLHLSEILVRASNDIEKADSRDEILRKVFQRSFDLIGEATGLVIAVESSGNLRIVDSKGVTDSQRNAFHDLSSAKDKGSFGWVISTCNIFECANTKEALSTGIMQDLGLPIPHSVTNVPIQIQGKVRGILVLDTIAPNDRVRGALLALARISEIALEKTQRAQMLAELNRVGKSLTQAADLSAVLAKIVHEAKMILGADAVTLHEYDRQKKCVKVPPTHIGLRSAEAYDGPKTFSGDSVAQRIARIGQTYYAEDAEKNDLTNEARRAGATPTFVEREGIKSSIGVPLEMAGETVGVLFINYRTPHEFTDLEKEEIALLASQAAVAIQNALRLEREQALRHQADTLREIGRSVSAILDLQKAADVILDEIIKVIEYRKATIQWIQADGDTRELASYRGFGPEGVDPTLLRPLSQDSFIKDIANGREPRILSRTKEHYNEGWGHNPNTVNVESWACVPLVAGNKTIGLLTLDHDQSGYYTAETSELLRLFGGQAAAAIQNARLYQEQERRVEAMALLQRITADISAEIDLDATLGRLLEGAMRLSGTSSGIIRLVDQKSLCIVKEYEFPLNFGHAPSRFASKSGMTWDIVNTGEAVFVSDISKSAGAINPYLTARGVRAYIGLPLKFGDQTVGALFLNDSRPHVFWPHEIELLTLLTNNAAVAIQKAKFVRALNDRIQDLSALTRISQGLNSPIPLTLHDMAEVLWEATRHLMDMSQFFVASYDKTQEKVEFDYVIEEGREVKDRPGEWEPRIRGHGLTEHVIKQRKLTYLTPDVGQARRDLGARDGLRRGVVWHEWEGSQDPAITGRSWLGIPIIVGQDVLGVIGVQNYDQPYAYDEYDQQVLAAVAAQLAIAIVRRELEIKNSKLHQALGQIERRNQELEVLTEIGRTVSNLPIDDVLDLVYEQMGRIMDLSNAQVQFAFNDESKHEVAFPLAVEQDNGRLIDKIRWGKREPNFQKPGEGEVVEQFNPRPRGTRYGLTELVIDTKASRLLLEEFKTVDFKVEQLDTFLFTISPDYIQELDSGLLSAKLQTQFMEHDHPLTEMSRIEGRKIGCEWLIVDDRKKKDYLIALRDQIPYVYPADSFVLDLPAAKAGTRDDEIKKVTVWRRFGRMGHSTNSWLGVPMIVQTHVIGIISIQSLGEDSPVDRGQLKVLETIASQAAVAIENANLYLTLVSKQAQIADSENARVRNQIAADLVHGLNNSLGTIPVRVALIQEKLNDSSARDSVLRHLRGITDDVHRVMKAAEVVRLLPRSEAIDDLCSMVQAIAEQALVSAYRQIELDLDCPPNLAQIRAARVNLLSALEFVIGNAVEAMRSEGKTLRIRVRNKIVNHGQYEVEIRVSNDGPIIRDELSDLLFQAGVTTKEGGRGYGLWRARYLMEEMGGSLALAIPEDDDFATVFVFRIPAASVPMQVTAVSKATLESEASDEC